MGAGGQPKRPDEGGRRVTQPARGLSHMGPLFSPFFHGTLREYYLLLFGAAGAIALTCGFVGAWIGAYIGARRAARRTVLEAVRAHPPAASVDEARLAQLVDAVDAIALEGERI